MSTPREQLYETEKSFPNRRPGGIPDSCLDEIVVDDDDWRNVAACIASSDSADNRAALEFLLHVSEKYSLEDKPFFPALVERIPEFLVSGSALLRYTARGYFVALHSYYDNFREVMLNYLVSDDLGERETALRHFKLYGSVEDLQYLIRYKDDDYASEQRMTGPYVYELRNRALTIIENLTGQDFGSKELTEPYEGSEVSWRSWAKVLEWWIKKEDLPADPD